MKKEDRLLEKTYCRDARRSRCICARKAQPLDFNIVKRQVIGEYLRIYGSDREGEDFSLTDCLNVFRYFYRKYKTVIGVDHPRLSKQTIYRILIDIPFVDKEDKGGLIVPSDYRSMIDKYFSTSFLDCDYSIAHFMSAGVKVCRFYEAVYRC